MLVDSHCHLEYRGLVEDQAAVLLRAREAGVGAFLNISTKRSEWEQVVATANREPDVFASVGIHPHEADAHEDLGRASLFQASEDSRVIGIGETGLDYFYEYSDREVQAKLFRMHIDVARETGLPVIIHTRDAEDDTFARNGEGDLPCTHSLFHSISGFWPKGPRSRSHNFNLRHCHVQKRQSIASCRCRSARRSAPCGN